MARCAQVTDGDSHPHKEGYLYFWDILEQAAQFMGFTSIQAKMHLPMWLLLLLATICEAIGYVLGVTLKVRTHSLRGTANSRLAASLTHRSSCEHRASL